MRQRRTRTGARRSGDDYQDLVAAKALLRVLKHPSRYRWVKFEAREAGTLDDVLVLRTDDVVEASQVKFSTDALRPGDPLTWEKLLDQPEGKNSLIQAWCKSIAPLDAIYRTTEPRLVSNRRAGDDFVLTQSGHVDRSRTDPAALEEIQSQLGDDADDFLKRFRFEVDEQDLGDLDESLMREFQALGLSEGNWLSLKEAIRSWIRGEELPETGEIRIDNIRSACGWRQLAPLPQNLEIPDDYTLPDSEFHESFLEQVKKGSGSTIVLAAEPGLGKSTYLSYLVQALRELNQPVIRHHYSLRPTADHLERMDSRRVAESLMANIVVELRAYLGELSNQNPNPDDLSVWLYEVGRQLLEKDQCLVVVVDGLDHVWRAKDSREELVNLFDQLVPVPPGVVLVVGTQPVEDQQLPPSLLTRAPRELWVELPRLDKEAIGEWLNHHRDLMPSEWDQDDHDWLRSQLGESLYSWTRGHPLLNRYIIQRIADGGERLTTDSIEAIPETPTDSLEDYYRALWVGLPEAARDVVFLLAIAKFRWPEDGLFRCLRLAGYERASSATAVAAIHHLLGRDAVGLWPFHGSILLYARQRREFGVRKPALREAVIEWLKKHAPDYWRRSYLWLLQLEAGDANPLVAGSDRQWAVEAVAVGHPLVEVVSVLRTAAWEAIDLADLPKYVDRGVLADAVAYTATNQDEALRWLFAAQLSLGTDDYLEPRAVSGIRELGDPHVLVLALHLHDQGKHDEAIDCFEEINRRLKQEAGDFHLGEDLRRRYEVVSELAGLVGVDPQGFAGFIAQLSAEDIQVSVAESWAAGQRRSGDVRSAVQALGEPISPSVQRCLSRHVAVVGADEGISLSQDERQLLGSAYALVYQRFHEGQLAGSPPEEPTPPDNAKGYRFEEYEHYVGRYVHDLFFFLLIRELQSPGFSSSWSPPTSLRTSLASSLKALAQGAGNVAAGLRHASTVPVTAAYDATQSFRRPSWGDPIDDRESADGVQRALRTITEDLLIFRRTTGGSAKLSWGEAETIASHNFAGFRDILRWTADGTTDIEHQAMDSLCKSLDDELAATIEPFEERATVFSMLATVCARSGFRTKAEHYLRRSSESLIAYGYHKDILLHIVLNAIEAGAQYFDTRQQLWFGLAPAISSVREFTDGDETSHLVARLGKLLLRFDPSLAIGYMTSLMDAEKYEDVEEVLHDLVRTGDLTDPVVGALVSTCVEPDAIRLLEERATALDPLAKEILGLRPGFSANFAKRDTGPRRGADFEGDSAGTRPKDRYLEFPPEQLDELVRSDGLVLPTARADELCAWLCRWAETDRAVDALDAVEPYFLADDRLRVSNQTVAAVRKIGGRTRSYAWLVRAQRSNHGWNEYWTDFEETKERWFSVKRDFSDLRHDFLVKSIRPRRGFSPYFGMTIARLVEYLIYFERWGDAYDVTCQIVDTVGGLVSGQELPIPYWTHPTAEGP